MGTTLDELGPIWIAFNTFGLQWINYDPFIIIRNHLEHLEPWANQNSSRPMSTHCKQLWPIWTKGDQFNPIGTHFIETGTIKTFWNLFGPIRTHFVGKHLKTKRTRLYFQHTPEFPDTKAKYRVFNRPGVAGAVLQTPSSLIHWVTESLILFLPIFLTS